MAISAVSPINTSASIEIPEGKNIVDLETEVKKNIEASIDYQIIKKTLFKKEVLEDDNEKKTILKGAENSDYALTEQTKTDLISISELAMNLSKNTETSRSDVLLETLEQASLSFSMQATETAEVEKSDPLALDLNGDGLRTTGVENGVLFDINGDGIKEKSSFVSGGDAFLAYDKNGNGMIDGAKELFGDSNGYQHGFAELASYDENKDGKIDSSDAIYDQLQLFSMDKNQQQQLSSLSESGIASISTGYSDLNQAINQYDSIAQIGEFEYKNGQKGIAGDLLLGHYKESTIR